MNKIVIVAVREFVETVKTRAFFFGVVLMPALIAGVILGGERISKSSERQAEPLRRIGVLDQGGVFEALRAQVDVYNAQNPAKPVELLPVDADEPESARLDRVRSGAWYAFIEIPQAAVDGNAPVQVARGDAALEMGRTIQIWIDDAVQSVRFARHEPPIDLALVNMLKRDVPVVSIDVHTGQSAGDDRMMRVMTPFIFMFLLYTGTFGISYGLLTSVLEEKSSRVVELLLSALSPTQLMAGKILGMVGVGVLMLAVWGGAGYAVASSRHMTGLVRGAMLFYVVLYFVPGFLLTSSLLAAVGAACNTLKEAQSMASPLSLLNIFPMVLWFQISQNPQGPLATVLSFIPPITPFVMVLRLCADANTPLWQVVASQALLWVSVIVAVWAAGKVFRVGVLMYGKPPTLGELVKWVRYE